MHRSVIVAVAALMMVSSVSPALAKGRGGGKPFHQQMTHSSSYHQKYRGGGFYKFPVRYGHGDFRRHKFHFIKFILIRHFFKHHGCRHGFGHGHGHKFGLIKHCPVSPH